MTGFAQRRAMSIAFFWTRGTSEKGSSTPRSPRATIMPSNLSMMSCRFSTAWGFSIFAITGTRMPSSSMILWTGSTSAPVRTKESAIMSAPIFSAKRRSSASFSVSAGRETAAPGRLIPLLLEMGPPTITRVRTVVGVTSIASRRILPSSSRSLSPSFTSPGRPL